MTCDTGSPNTLSAHIGDKLSQVNLPDGFFWENPEQIFTEDNTYKAIFINPNDNKTDFQKRRKVYINLPVIGLPVSQVTPTEGEKAVYVNKPELVLSRESKAYKTIEQVNPNLPKGERHVQVKGELGERLLVKEVVKVGDNVISSQDLPSLVTKEAVDEVVEVGTQEVVSQVTPTEGVKAVYVNKPELVLSRESIAYQTIEQVNPNLPKGERHVQVKGELGERLLVKEVVKVGDNVISSQDLPSLVTKESVDEVVEVGSREVLAGTDGTISTNTDSYKSSFLPSQLGKESIPSKDSKESMRQDKEVSTEVEKPIYSSMERYHSSDSLPNTGEEGSGLFFVGMSLLGLGMVSKKRRRG